MKLVVLASFFISLGALFAQGPATMGVSEIRAGMKGHGRTVFQGGKIDRFEFEVVGVQKNAAPGRSRIMVRASGGPLADTGILAGMSGSPCYIDGKLIGALSTGIMFEKEPIGGITPIAEMLEQLKDIPDIAPSRTPLILPKLEPPKVLKSALLGQMLPFSEVMGDLDPQALPMALAGSPLGTEAQRFWAGWPVTFAAGPALSGGREEASPLEPGGMAAISLMQGDLDLTASGTITYVSGKRVLMFGHQLFNLGPVDLPLWSATVATTVSSYQSSFKLAMPVAPIGALRLDRNSGVAGILGAEARMVPMRLGLNLGGKRTLNFRFELMDHPVATAALAATAVAQTLDAHTRGLGFQSLSMQGNIKLAGHPAIQIENVIADLNPGRLAQYLGGMLQAICLNPFEKPVFEGISITIKAEERLDLTAIAGVRLLKARAKRGEVLPVLVTLQNIQGVRETATFNIQVPSSAAKGKATLMVGDGFSLMAADPDERAIETASMGDVVRILNGALRNNHAYALLVQVQPGAGLRGSRIEGIPPTVASLVGGDGASSDNRLQRRIVGRALLPLEREVRGLSQIEVEIE
ncbi:SpoIVB peptidase S55 domain-containing protein [Geothrix sp. PMB-07]|uniref:SpoIVB peptidase S55 domain-containing protein n=1 Tax=Geothrix sp. PMB-07 TaxID=3068640 RepID=UPI002741EB6A|nr:SpoIVB peptidase S55 domain-containing protein [Geothrix sp. PMB-07]WLT30030.1 SpoIVB peptidase S55 domain-containing protein [Geothrix sp. PMB-07]